MTERSTADALLFAAGAAAGAALVCFLLMTGTTLPDGSTPILGALAGVFTTTALCCQLAREYATRENGR